MDELFSPQFNFLGLSTEFSNFDNSKFFILPIPYDGTTTYIPGTRFAPEAIIAASRYIELFDEDLGIEPYKFGIHTMPSIQVVSAGPEQMIEKIGKVVRILLKTKRTLISIGGEHSVTFPIVSNFKTLYKKNFGVLQFDAHADFRTEYEGTSFSHACVMRKIFDLDVPIFQVGIRSVSSEEYNDLQKSNVKTFWMKDIAEAQTDTIASELIKILPANLYITIDLDVLDPSIMPATGTPEPGGMSWYQILKILRLIILSKNICGMDFCELCPIPGFAAPTFLAAKLIYKCIGFLSKKLMEPK